MNTDQTIQTFIEFFRERGHQLITGSTLLPPPGDPVLFTTSGMHPLIPYLEGRPHPLGRRLVNLQRCLRTTDLDEVGDYSHLTVFEMLGSWSLGDYQGPQSLRWGYELLRDGYGIGRDRLHATVFGGDEQVGLDTAALRTWHELGVPVEQTREGNWWSNGLTGPCGPDSELFVWTGSTSPEGTPGSDQRWVELWNHVMMRYRRLGDGSLEPLVQSNVDTGMGLERLLTVLQGKQSVERDQAPGVRVPGTRDEIAALARTMNQLLSRLHGALARQRALVADASHELRTPFAVLSGELELAGRPGRSRAELNAAVARASDEVTRLTRLTDQLLFLARSDEDRIVLQPERVSMPDLLIGSAEQAAGRASAVGVSCQVEAPAGLMATLDPDRIREAIDNLVDNALRFAPTGTPIVISARAAGPDLEIEVRDRGPGFPAQFLPHAFERFRRPDSGRARSDGGAGLGLAIVSAIAQAHGGRATARYRPEGGAVVMLELPDAAEPGSAA